MPDRCSSIAFGAIDGHRSAGAAQRGRQPAHDGCDPAGFGIQTAYDKNRFHLKRGFSADVHRSWHAGTRRTAAHRVAQSSFGRVPANVLEIAEATPDAR